MVYRGNPSLLVYLLHRSDGDLDLLLRRDRTYAAEIQSGYYPGNPSAAAATTTTTTTTTTTYEQSQFQQTDFGIHSNPIVQLQSTNSNLNSAVMAMDPSFSQQGNHFATQNYLVSSGVEIGANVPSSTYRLPVQETLPHLFYCDRDLCGMIMKRTKTKLFFRKWKHCIFSVRPQSLFLYKTVEDWRKDCVYWQTPIHRGMV